MCLWQNVQNRFHAPRFIRSASRKPIFSTVERTDSSSVVGISADSFFASLDSRLDSKVFSDISKNYNAKPPPRTRDNGFAFNKFLKILFYQSHKCPVLQSPQHFFANLRSFQRIIIACRREKMRLIRDDSQAHIIVAAAGESPR